MKVAVVATAAVVAFAAGVAAPPAAEGTVPEAKKLNACKLVSESALETAVGNPLDTPEDTTTGPIEASCRFPATDPGGTDLNLFLSSDVKGGIKKSFRGNYFATQKTFKRVYGTADPVSGIGKQAYSAYDQSSIAQGALLVLDKKNHAALVLLTGEGVTAENTVTNGKAVAQLVLAKLK